MGKPSRGNTLLSHQVDLGVRRTRGSETSQYPEEKERNIDFLSSGERKGKSPNPAPLLQMRVKYFLKNKQKYFSTLSLNLQLSFAKVVRGVVRQ